MIWKYLNNTLLCVVSLTLLVNWSLGMDGFDRLYREIEKNRRDFKLDNGIEVVILNLPGVNSVNAVFGFKAGSVFESKPGIANIVSESLLYKNKKYKNLFEISDFIESIGGNIDTFCDYDYAGISLKVLSEDIEISLEKVFELISYFDVDDEVLGIIKPQVLSELSRIEDDPWNFARTKFLELVYGSVHPYGRTVLGTKDGVENITKYDVQEFFRDYYIPENLIIVIVGNLNLDKTEKLISKVFSRIKPSNRVVEFPKHLVISNSFRDIDIKKELKQSTIRIGHVSSNVEDSNYYKLWILNFIIGGSGFGSRLMEEIREKRGLAYGVFSNFYIDRILPGYFFMSTQTENKNVKKVIEIMTNEIHKIINEGVTEKEVEEAKNFARGSLPLSIEKPNLIASSILKEKMYNLERNEFIKSVEKIEKITKDDINEISKKYLRPQEFVYVVVGGD